jgi:hypothetical protein
MEASSGVVYGGFIEPVVVIVCLVPGSAEVDVKLIYAHSN